MEGIGLAPIKAEGSSYCGRCGPNMRCICGHIKSIAQPHWKAEGDQFSVGWDDEPMRYHENQVQG